MRWKLLVALGLLMGAPAGWAAELSVGPFVGTGRLYASVQSLHELRWKYVVRQGLDISCGSAALSTILRYQFGDEVSEKVLLTELFKRLDPKAIKTRGGFSLLDLKGIAMQLGYTVKGYKLSLDDVVGLGQPVIVPIEFRGIKHFVVFRGVIADRVILADPAFGNTMITAEQFERIWPTKAVLVITRNKGTPPTAQLQPVAGELSVVEPREAFRLLLDRATTHIGVHPDEF